VAYREYREPVYRDDPVVVQRSAPAVYDRGDSWTSYAFVKYAFILAITIVVLYFVARYVLPMIGGSS